MWRFGRIIGTLFDPGCDIPEGRVPGYYAVGDAWLPYVTTNVAIRRDAFERWGRFKTGMRTLDTELFARFLSQGLEVTAIRRPLSLRRLHGEQLTDRYAENFEESMQALAASGADEATKRRLREAVACEVALYLLKSGRPRQARAFLADKFGEAARKTRVWPWTLVPAWAIMGLRALRHG